MLPVANEKQNNNIMWYGKNAIVNPQNFRINVGYEHANKSKQNQKWGNECVYFVGTNTHGLIICGYAFKNYFRTDTITTDQPMIQIK